MPVARRPRAAIPVQRGEEERIRPGAASGRRTPPIARSSRAPGRLERSAVAERDVLFSIFDAFLPRPEAAVIADELILRFGCIPGVLAAREARLAKVPGLDARGVRLLKGLYAATACFAAGPLRDGPLLNSWDSVCDYLGVVLAHESVERFRVLFLDAKNRLIADEELGTGSVSGVPVYPREVVRRALEHDATALILAHNHPSGDPTPSREDIDMTREVGAAAATIGISLHDHLIVGRRGCTSLRRLGLL